MTLSIRTKIVIAQTILIILVSAFIYSYYPDQQKQLALHEIDGKIRSISNMFSIGVGIGMGETDFVAVAEALNWANNDTAVVYISVTSNSDQSIALMNPHRISIPNEIVKGGFMEYNQIVFYRTHIVYQNIPLGTLTIGYSLQPLYANLKSLKRTTLYFCLSLFACGVLISIIIAKRITRNITILDNAVKAIAKGVEDVRVNVTGNDEIGELGKAFNQMVDNLHVSKTELVNYSNQLKKQNEELNQFSYLVSHDLKAPLRAIFKLSEWLEEDLGENLSVESKKNLETLKGRVFRMEALINGLLEYSKIGRLNFQSEKTDTHHMLKEIIEILDPSSASTIMIGPNMPLFKTKKILLYQVFSNLLSNALKYNDKDTPLINIDVQEIDHFFQFTVADNGMGIDSRYHEKIFAMFQRLAARDKVEGAGVGLSIAKKSIEDVGGTIRLQSEPGEGSRFIFTWPKRLATPIKLQLV